MSLPRVCRVKVLGGVVLWASPRNTDRTFVITLPQKAEVLAVAEETNEIRTLYLKVVTTTGLVGWTSACYLVEEP